MKRSKRWLWLLVLIPLLVLAGFTLWAYTPAAPMPKALAALQSDPQVQVDTDRWLTFRPTGKPQRVGLILYPGGRVDPRAYAPAAHAIAARGYPTIITPMPFNLAVFDSERAVEVMAAFPDVEYWAVGGHSLGGAMAARFAWLQPDLIQGLVLWAAYPAQAHDLSAHDLEVVSIYATRDGLTTREDIEASRRLLPPDTQWVPVEGGNHAQFGWYGPQAGDNEAIISRQAQQDQVVEATLGLLSRVLSTTP